MIVFESGQFAYNTTEAMRWSERALNAWEILQLEQGAPREKVREAYRKLAKRWHPDRFMPGPEREWANEKMTQINAAYQECLKSAAVRPAGETEQLRKIEDMIRTGALQDARHMLMSFSTRCAEWNYLFGAVLYKMREYEKALTFLGVALHQKPDYSKYSDTYAQVEREWRSTRRSRFGFPR